MRDRTSERRRSGQGVLGKTRRDCAIALVVSLLVLAATGGAWALLLVSIIALAHALPARGAITGTTVARFLIATLAVLMFYQVESVIAWLCRVHASPQLYVFVAAVVVGILWVLVRCVVSG